MFSCLESETSTIFLQQCNFAMMFNFSMWRQLTGMCCGEVLIVYIYHPFTFCCSQHPPTRPREVFLFIFLHSFPVDFFSVFSSFPAISSSLIRGRHINLQHYTTVLVFSVASLSRFLLLRLATTHNINLRNNSHIFSLPPDRKNKTKERRENPTAHSPCMSPLYSNTFSPVKGFTLKQTFLLQSYSVVLEMGRKRRGRKMRYYIRGFLASKLRLITRTSGISRLQKFSKWVETTRNENAFRNARVSLLRNCDILLSTPAFQAGEAQVGKKV